MGVSSLKIPSLLAGYWHGSCPHMEMTSLGKEDKGIGGRNLKYKVYNTIIISTYVRTRVYACICTCKCINAHNYTVSFLHVLVHVHILLHVHDMYIQHT